MVNDGTISAISTANGPGGVAIIRISGADALKIAERMFRPVKKFSGEPEPYRMYPGEILAEYFSDFGMFVYFKGPKSYTGEDVVEFHCHGGTEIAKGVLKQIFACGARPAEAGEFTKRAFLNGKMTLSAAEGVADMINAHSESMIRAGYSLLNNELGEKVSSMQDRIKNLLASIEVDLDYPEEDLIHSLPDLSGIEGLLSGLVAETDGLMKSYSSYGRTVKRGITVAIVGKPNAGKSSLLNAFLGQNKAIVSEIQGTTRDIVEGEIDLHGIRFRLFDTAGIRESDDLIERIGVEKAEEILDEADVVLHVLDGTATGDAEDVALQRRIESRERFLTLSLVNKSDLGGTWRQPDGFQGELISVSAKDRASVERVLDRIYNEVKGKYTFDSGFVIEERHYRSLERAKSSLERALNGCRCMTMDFLTVDISEVWQALGEITGETANEEIIQEIFSKFCVGK